MYSSTLRKTGLYILIFNFIVATFPSQALAGIIATPVAISAQENNNTVSHLKELLAREDVRGQLVQLGIDPAVAEQRWMPLPRQKSRDCSRNSTACLPVATACWSSSASFSSC